MDEKKLELLYDEVHEMITVLKGYNGYPGLLKEFAELKSEFWLYIENRERTCPINSEVTEMLSLLKEYKNDAISVAEKNTIAINDLRDKINKIENKSGRTALKWLNRVGVALIGAACVAFFTLWMDTTIVKKEPIKKEIHTPSYIESPQRPESSSPPIFKKE
jgi:hypothetical protein